MRVLGLTVRKEVYHHSVLTVSQGWGISGKDPMTNSTVGSPEGFMNFMTRFSVPSLR